MHFLLLYILTVLEEKTTELFCELCNGLYELLDRRKLLGKTSAKRTTILKMIFKFLDTDSDPMKLKLARIILAVSWKLPNNTDLLIHLVLIITRLVGSEFKQFDEHLSPHVFLEQTRRKWQPICWRWLNWLFHCRISLSMSFWAFRFELSFIWY